MTILEWLKRFRRSRQPLRCPRCKTNKPPAEFYITPAGKRNSTYCRKCHGDYHRERNKRLREALGKGAWYVRDREPGTLRCSRCKTVKPEAEFGLNRSRPTGRGHACRPCARKYGRDRRRRIHAIPRERWRVKEDET